MMRYFTPELFVRYNCLDDEEADRADADWESAIRRYQEQLAKLRPLMPPSVEKLAELHLHDAEVLSCGREPSAGPPRMGSAPDPETAILSLGRDKTVVSLVYQLWDTPKKREYEGRWPFSKRNPHWLYDEIDVDPSGEARFVHRILFSDGTVLEIPFRSILVHTTPMKAADDPSWSKRIA